jgi:hypothetical protein
MFIPLFEIFNLTDSREIVNRIFEVSINFFQGSVAVAAQTLEESHFSGITGHHSAPHPRVCAVIIVFVDFIHENVVTVNVVIVKVIKRLTFEPDSRHQSHIPVIAAYNAPLPRNRALMPHSLKEKIVEATVRMKNTNN